ALPIFLRPSPLHLSPALRRRPRRDDARAGARREARRADRDARVRRPQRAAPLGMAPLDPRRAAGPRPTRLGAMERCRRVPWPEYRALLRGPSARRGRTVLA